MTSSEDAADLARGRAHDALAKLEQDARADEREAIALDLEAEAEKEQRSKRTATDITHREIASALAAAYTEFARRIRARK